jgi:sugar phosphate isomerase/epimerase
VILGLTSGGWMSALYTRAPDPYKAQIELLAQYDLHATGWSSRELMAMEQGRREEIAGWLEEHDIQITLGVGFNYFTEDEDEVQRGLDAIAEALEVLPPLMRSTVCTTGAPRHIHRFTREPPLPKQLDILAERLGPVAALAKAAGLKLAYHNVVRYCSDIAEVCRRVPNFGFVFDTGNCFLVGDRPAQAARDAAPYTFAMHFKDHYVMPSLQRPMGVHIRGAVPGQGDVGLREVWAIVKAEAPDLDRLVVEMEIDPVEGMEQHEALEQAIAFMRSL